MIKRYCASYFELINSVLIFKGIECPSCRKVFPSITKEQLSNWPKNLALNNAVSHFKGMSTDDKSAKNEDVKFCGDHPTENVNLVCEPCKLPVCHLCLCADEGKHAGHKVVAIKTATQKIKV